VLLERSGLTDAGGRPDKTEIKSKKQGAAGITTAAPYVAGQWGRGEDRLF